MPVSNESGLRPEADVEINMNLHGSPRILPGLPGEGKLPLQFSATGMGMHSEGLVVEFGADQEEDWHWIGNFQPGGAKFSGVLVDDDSLAACVFARGQGYAVNVITGELLVEFGGDVDSVLEIHHLSSILLCGQTDFELRRKSGSLVWRSRRVSWDGFRNLEVKGDQLSGEAWMFDDTWDAFTLNLLTGTVVGGSYYDPP